MKTTIVSSAGESENPAGAVSHSRHIRKELDALIEHLQEDGQRVADPKFCALVNVTAVMLAGIRTAFADYDEGRESSLQPSG